MLAYKDLILNRGKFDTPVFIPLFVMVIVLLLLAHKNCFNCKGGQQLYSYFKYSSRQKSISLS